LSFLFKPKDTPTFLLKYFHLHFPEILIKNISIITLIVEINTGRLFLLIYVLGQEKRLLIWILLGIVLVLFNSLGFFLSVLDHSLKQIFLLLPGIHL